MKTYEVNTKEIIYKGVDIKAPKKNLNIKMLFQVLMWAV